MNSKRKAELQRRLATNAVPRPPAGLAERIKADIPRYLETESAARRFSRAIFNMRVAAAALLVVISAAIAVTFLEEDAARETMSRPVVFAPAARAITDTASSARTEEVRLEMTEEAHTSQPVVTTNVEPSLTRRADRSAVPAVAARETAAREETVVARAAAADSADAAGGVVDATGGAVGGVIAPRQIAAATAAPPPPPPAAAPAPAPSAATAVPERPGVAAAEASRLDTLAEARPSGTAAGRKESVFGISVDPSAFQKIQTTIESGGRPAASEVDVEALVNYFARKPQSPPRRGVRLEVEASPAPIEAEGDHAVLRFSVDTPAADTRRSAPPIASDARVEVTFNGDVVARAKRIGDDDPLARESGLLYGTSVTGLYAIELKPNLKSSHLVASVTLHYTSVADGRTRAVRQQVHGRDLARGWQRASRRHRLASLGAVWGETLKGTAAGFDVARRAAELATQDPKDPRARELAAVASASGGGSS